METSVLHIKTEVECKVFLFDEEIGIASPGKYFNLEVKNGYQDFLFVSTTEDNTCCYHTILIEKEDTEYHINLCKGDFQQLTIEIIQLMKSTCRGDVEAQSKLGACYIEGRGLINKDFNAGLLLLKRAVAVGNPYAQNAVGFCFENGLGVPKDYYKAVFWYRKAAEQDNATAQYHLASCYEWGLGVDKNLNEAFKWMKKAAMQGKHRAQIALGRYYEEGIGVTIDLEESLKWYNKAAVKGDVNAIDSIKRIQKNKQESMLVPTKITKEDYINCFYDEKSVLYSSNGEILILCSNPDIQDYEVQEGCKTIKDKAFCMSRAGRGCSISSVILPNSISHIGDNAFLGCGDLKKVIIQEGLVYIGNSAFELCGSLSSIALPTSLIHLGERAFFGCRNLSEITIPQGLKQIEKMTFGACRSLSSISFPDNITHIGDGAFTMCESLINVILPERLVHLGDRAFSMCENLVSISLPDSITFLGDEVFRSCKRLREILIPVGSRYKFESLLAEDLHDLLVESYSPIACRKNTFGSSLKQPCYLFFDTETTGIPRDYNAPASNTRNWPRLVQLGWILTDESGNEISSGNEIVKPEGFVIPTDASKVHGITTEIALRDGKPLKQVIQSFLKDTNGIRCFVGHNVSFDQRVVGAELYRLGIADTVSTAKSLDTMKAATDYCKIPDSYGYKWPKLIELHRKLFGCDFEDAHDAMADITATKKCFFEMKRRKLI